MAPNWAVVMAYEWRWERRRGGAALEGEDAGVVTGHGGLHRPPCSLTRVTGEVPRRVRLRRVYVLGARSLRPLADGERHVLTFPEVIKPHRAAGGLMEEILVTVGRSNEAKTLVRHALDRSVHRSHSVVPFELS